MHNMINRRAFTVGNESSPEERQVQLPIYPFYHKFSHHKTNRVDLLPRGQTESQESTQPFVTAISESQDYEDEEFQSYTESQQYQQIAEEPELIHQSSDLKQNNSSPQDEDECFLSSSYSDFSEGYLRKMNEKLVILKEQYRKIAIRYKHNAFIIHRQRQELLLLRSLKQKALDYDYELAISHQYTKKRVYSHQVSESINKEATIIKKHKYQRLKEQQSLNDPDNASCILNSSRVLDNKSQVMFKLLSKREEILSKLRKFDRNQAYLGMLAKKQVQYKQMIDVYNSTLCKGSIDTLEKRAQFLRREIEIKKNMFCTREMEVDLESISLQNDIIATEMKIKGADMKIEELKSQILEMDLSSSKIKVKFNSFGRKKKNLSVMTPQIEPIISRQLIKLKKIQTPPVKQKIAIVFHVKSPAISARSKQQRFFKANNGLQRSRQHTVQQ